MPARAAASLTTSQRTFGVIPFFQILPALLIDRNMRLQDTGDRGWRILLLFETDSVSEDHSAVEGQAWFRKVPLDEFSDRMILCALPAL